MIADHLNGRLPGLVGPGDRRWSYAYVEDVAEGHAARAREGQGRRPLRAGRRERHAHGTSSSCCGDRRREAAAPADPVRGRLRWSAARVAVGGAHGPSAAAHPRRGRACSARWACTTARRPCPSSATSGGRSPTGLRETVRWLRAADSWTRAGRFVSLSRGELARRVVHVSCVAFALLLRWLTWPQAGGSWRVAAFVFNWQVLPRLGGRGMWRSADDRGAAIRSGSSLYPLGGARPRPVLPRRAVDGGGGLGDPGRRRRHGGPRRASWPAARACRGTLARAGRGSSPSSSSAACGRGAPVGVGRAAARSTPTRAWPRIGRGRARARARSARSSSRCRRRSTTTSRCRCRDDADAAAHRVGRAGPARERSRPRAARRRRPGAQRRPRRLAAYLARSIDVRGRAVGGR